MFVVALPRHHAAKPRRESLPEPSRLLPSGEKGVQKVNSSRLQSGGCIGSEQQRLVTVMEGEHFAWAIDPICTAFGSTLTRQYIPVDMLSDHRRTDNPALILLDH